MEYFTVTTIILICLVALKLYLKLTTGWDKSTTSLNGKTVIVTGGNTGIGYYTALDFARRGARVILACRDLQKAINARNNIIRKTRNDDVVIKLVDMSSLESVRNFARDINSSEARLDILVNNAGAAGLGNKMSQDGLQLLIQVNHFGPFLLTHLLIDLLKKSEPSRIVNVSSMVAHWGAIDADNFNSFPKGNVTKADSQHYNDTKLLNVLFTNELSRRLQGTGVTTNSLHPGAVQTELARRMPVYFRLIFSTVAALFFKTAEEGAQTSIYLSVSKEVDGISGKYFEDCKLGKMPVAAADVELANKVWEKSEIFVNLRPEERLLKI